MKSGSFSISQILLTLPESQRTTLLKTLCTPSPYAESGRKGYIITKNPLYLETYAADKQKVYQALKSLQKLTQDNSKQQRRLNELQPLIAKRLASLDRSINLFQQNSSDIASQIAITDED